MTSISSSSEDSVAQWQPNIAITRTRTYLPVRDMPATTRMLLASDGSTTLLLQALAGFDLIVDVVCQKALPARDIDPIVAEHICVDPDSSALVRRSRLVDNYNKRIVSDNYVVMPASTTDTTITSAMDSASVPIGLGFIQSNMRQRREILSQGRASWIDDTQCAFKEYVIQGHCRIYLYETFNPNIVPVH